jgi:hypothetical protein
LSPRAWQILSAVAAVLVASPAAAFDGPECFSKFTKTNICEFARTAQAEVANGLPMKLNNNVTLVTAVVAGTKLIINASFQMTKAGAEALAAERGITMASWNEKMVEYTRNSVCSDKLLSAFVRLGGQLQYIYKTLDGFPIFQPEVGSC